MPLPGVMAPGMPSHTDDRLAIPCQITFWSSRKITYFFTSLKLGTWSYVFLKHLEVMLFAYTNHFPG